uniref:Uncharacterized protein n=1 Tax=Strongyloides venezuelensis TaxID=75913 RepID=A0A0K0FPR1_STRVS
MAGKFSDVGRAFRCRPGFPISAPNTENFPPRLPSCLVLLTLAYYLQPRGSQKSNLQLTAYRRSRTHLPYMERYLILNYATRTCLPRTRNFSYNKYYFLLEN